MEVFGNIHVLVQIAIDKLANIQSQIIRSEDNKNVKEQETLAQQELEKVLAMEVVFLRDKAKTKWHLKGDINTSCFHKCSKIRKAKNTITHFRTNEGLIHDPVEMATHVVTHFTNLFCFARTHNDLSLMYEVI